MRNCCGFALGAALLFGGGGATAQGGDPLLSLCSGFLDQSAGGVSGNKQKLCSCLVRETPAQLTQEEMIAYAEATVNNRAPPDAVTRKMVASATMCLTEAQ